MIMQFYELNILCSINKKNIKEFYVNGGSGLHHFNGNEMQVRRVYVHSNIGP